MHWAVRPDEGALLVGEISYRCNQASEEELAATRTNADERRPDTAASKPTRGLAGSYEAGFLHHTDAFADIHDVTLEDLGSSLAPIEARDRGANYAIYLNLEQEVWREPGSEIQGLRAFAHRHRTWSKSSRDLGAACA